MNTIILLFISFTCFLVSILSYQTNKRFKKIEGNIKHIEEYLKNKQA